MQELRLSVRPYPTSDVSPTGQRYINHMSMGTSVLLFGRESSEGVGGAATRFFSWVVLTIVTTRAAAQ
jgi:hypothetical protein